MLKKYTPEEMLIRDRFAEVALKYWLEEFSRLKQRKPDSSFEKFKRTVARLSFYTADSMMEARRDLDETSPSPDL